MRAHRRSPHAPAVLATLMVATALVAAPRPAMAEDPDVPSRSEVRAAGEAVEAGERNVVQVRADLAAAQVVVDQTAISAARAAEAFNGARYVAQQARAEATVARRAERAALARVARGRGPLAEDWPVVVERHLDLPLPVTPSPGFKGSASTFSRGLYGEQLARGLSVFAADQWLVLEFGAMLDDFPGTLDRLTDHLGLRRFGQAPPMHHELPGAPQVSGTAPTGAELTRIAERFRADLTMLSRLPVAAGLDLGAWPTRQLLDGELDPEDLAARFARRIAPG